MSYLSSDYFQRLDEDRKAAVTAGRGLVRVRAGAGTGKTTTLIARILYLLMEERIEPRHIMAVTFTNKAADEIRSRLHEVIDHHGLSRSLVHPIRIGTFHSHCARFLRRSASVTGIPRNFTIIDEEESRTLVRSIFHEKALAERHLGFDPSPEEEIRKQRERFLADNAGG